ncbi:hypothetical protein DFH28DRAFT_960536 [Melampsora americana]|nr:hypothetical protein DFH28DRAFT_960536 [Melampsora americana]
MAKVKTGVNKRLGWFQRNRFPLFDAVGFLVDPGMAKGRNRVDSVTSATHHIEESGNNKEEETSSGKLMSDDNTDIEDPTSTTHDLNWSGTKSKKINHLKHPQTPEPEGHHSRSKSSRKSAAQAGEEFIEGIDGTTDKLISHMTKDTNNLASGTSAQPYDFLTSATQGLRKLGLTQAELYKAMDLLKSDVDYAKLFVGLEEKELQVGWIKGKLADN